MSAVIADQPATTTRQSARASRRRRGSASTLVIALLAMAGSTVLAYPSAAGWFAQLEQSDRVDDYAEVMTALGPEGREQELAEARDYNATLAGGALIDPYGGTPLSDQRAIVAAYERQLDLGPADVMARIRIPSIAVDLPIYHGTDEATLRRGIGHLLGSSLPVGGDGTHSVLTGHRGLPEAVLFSDLDEVEPGDLFEVDVYGEVLTYQVRDVEVIDPGNTDVLLPESGRDLVSLVTCTPLGVNSHRIIVTGERIANPASDDPATAMPEIPGPAWWAVALAGGWALAAGYRSLTARPREPGAEPPLEPERAVEPDIIARRRP
ncbi:class C sortase [Agrococcus carbonis]|uniref:Sortase A n=1 Tax=Agrococcus carbonis TaxID=684552 RepID=A0A1H1N7B8_9MICO|nr:class C sortase [Agrococcus carbonis]SDR94896.1 sortase A [Agrococcus carbonis]